MLGIGLSTDRGQSWQSSFGLKSYEVGGLTWHPTNPTVVWAGTMSGPYVSTDGGVNWKPRRNGLPDVSGWIYSAPIEKVLFDPNDFDHLIGIGGSNRRWSSPGDPAWGAVWESTNGGATWQQKSTLTADSSAPGADPDGINIVSATFAAQSSTTLFAGVAGQGFYKSTDGGTGWTKSNSGLPHTNIERVVAHPTDPAKVYISLGNDAMTPGGVYRSTDGGISWSDANSGLPRVVGPHNGNTSRYKALVISVSEPDTLVAADSGWGSRGIYRTSDSGDHWVQIAEKGDVEVAYPAGLEPMVATIDPNDSGAIFAAGTAYVVRSLDAGGSWFDATSQPVDGTDGYTGRGFSGLVARNVEFNPFDPDHVILQAMDAGKLWQTKDGMTSWQRKISTPSPWRGGNVASRVGCFRWPAGNGVRKRAGRHLRPRWCFRRCLGRREQRPVSQRRWRWSLVRHL